MATYHRAAARANLTPTWRRIDYPAIVLTALFVAGTGYVLFEDVLRHGASFTPSHLLTLLAMIGTLASGHYVLAEARAGNWMIAAGCAFLFVAGSTYIATASGARNATTARAKAAEAEQINDKRAAAKAKADEAAADLREYRATAKAKADEQTKACKSGDGPLCKGATKTREYADRDVEKAESHARITRASFDIIEPPADPSSGLEHVGRVFASLPFVTSSAETITAALELLLPFLKVLIAEAGCLVFASMALRLKPVDPMRDQTGQTSFSEPTAADIDVLSGDWPEPPKPGARSKPSERQRVVTDFVAGYRARHGRDPEPREVRAATGLPRATAHRYQRRA